MVTVSILYPLTIEELEANSVGWIYLKGKIVKKFGRTKVMMMNKCYFCARKTKKAPK